MTLPMKKQTAIDLYNQSSQFFYIVRDDGDHFPSPRDTYFSKQSGKKVSFCEVVSDVSDFYKKIPNAIKKESKKYGGSEELEVKIPRGVWLDYKKNEKGVVYFKDQKGKVHTTCSPVQWSAIILEAFKEIIPKENELFSAYDIAAYFSYQPNAVTDRLAELLKKVSIPLSYLLTMERTAKARGNVEFGKKLHQQFETLVESNPYLSKDFVKIGYKDAWGDFIYFRLNSDSFKTWNELKPIFERESPQSLENFSKMLAYFDSVNFLAKESNIFATESSYSLEIILGLIKVVPEFYAQGIPMPRELQIFNFQNNGEAFYQPFSDDIILSRGLKIQKTLSHELGHFLTDLLDDKGGPNSSLFEPQTKFEGNLLFSAQSCNILASVSVYAGTCDQFRKDKREKKFEDLASTFASAYLLLNNNPPSSPQFIPPLKNSKTTYEDEYQEMSVFEKEATSLLSKLEGELPWHSLFLTSSKRDQIIKDATEYVEKIHCTPLFANKNLSDADFLIEMKKWIQKIKIEKETALKIRKAKIQWMSNLLKELKPLEGEPKRPRIDRAPWNIQIKL